MWNALILVLVEMPKFKYKYGNRHFWCRGYYVDTVGKNAKKIKEYVKNQMQEDLEYDQMSLKEYIDPFTGAANDIFAENAWYFRNALVRANYTNLQVGVYETTEYLEAFLRNLLLNEKNELHNRNLHISGLLNEEKVDIEEKKWILRAEKWTFKIKKWILKVCLPRKSAIFR